MTGIIYAILATIAYSSTATFTQLAYKTGMATNTLLFSRHLVSLVFLLPLLLKKDAFASVGRKQIPGILLLSASNIWTKWTTTSYWISFLKFSKKTTIFTATREKRKAPKAD